MKREQVKHKPILLIVGERKAYISPCEGPVNGLSYLWIGTDEKGCYGVVPDGEVERLRDWCDQILKARLEEKRG